MKAIAATKLGSRRDFFWLDNNYSMNTQSPVMGAGFNLNFGGIFTSPPAAVMMNAHAPVVIHPVADPNAAPATGPVIGPLTPRLDLFGLGLDYAMYHKRFWGAFDQNDFQTPWQSLDGIFTSAPAAIDWGNERVDVFGLGLDHAGARYRVVKRVRGRLNRRRYFWHTLLGLRQIPDGKGDQANGQEREAKFGCQIQKF